MDKRILEFKRELANNKSDYETLDEFYSYVKKIAPNYYENGAMVDIFMKIIFELKLAEREMKKDYLIEPVIDYKRSEIFKNKVYDHFKVLLNDPEEILDYIVYCTRLKLSYGLDLNELFNTIDLTNKCKESSIFVNQVCAGIPNIKFESIRIDPGYDVDYGLFGGGGFHYFNIITIKDKKYIVDCSYKQFFKKAVNSLEKLGIPKIRTPYMGIFMLVDEKRKQLATELLSKGWIEMTDENLKMYLDGFTISFRNGLYYEAIGKPLYETDYTVTDYNKFLNHKDSQVLHESIVHLGLQLSPLKNSKFDFKI